MPRKKKDKETMDIKKNDPGKDVVPPPLSAEKPIRSWFDIVSQEQSKVDPPKALEIQQWVESISRTPELLHAIQATLKPPPLELLSILGPSPTGITPLPISKMEKGESSSQLPLSQSVLTPSSISQQNSQIILTQSKAETTKFFPKNTIQNILTVEDGFYHKDPFFTLQLHFPKNWFFKPWDLSKPREFYQTILEFTGSVEFKHFYHKGSHDPSYSTCKILKVLHPQEWG